MPYARTSRKIAPGQEPLPFGGRRRAGILAYAFPWERRFAFFLLAAFVALSAFYTYFMISSVFHVAARQDLVSRSTALSADVASLEASYLARTQSITPAYAASLGYVPIATETFATRDTAVAFHSTR